SRSGHRHPGRRGSPLTQSRGRGGRQGGDCPRHRLQRSNRGRAEDKGRGVDPPHRVLRPCDRLHEGAGRLAREAWRLRRVVRLLLDETLKAAAQQNLKVRCGHKVGEDDFGASKVVAFKDNAEALASLRAGSIGVLGGTAWLWSREEFENAVDVLVIDEAGQL